ncbi:hypothetical protein ACFL4Q_03525 [candidate division KSB1 bacterium]
MAEEEITCGFCGKISKHTVVTSTNELGYSDLDLRPPEMMRSTINELIQCCPHCDYCAPYIEDINKEIDVKEIINCEVYKKTLNDDDYPLPARYYICSAMIQEGEESLVGAFTAYMHAAWVCDDIQKDELAITCREKAVRILEKAKSNGISLYENAIQDICIEVDLLRRMGHSDQAVSLIKENYENIEDDFISKVLDFHMVLIQKNDSECHNIGEIVEKD